MTSTKTSLLVYYTYTHYRFKRPGPTRRRSMRRLTVHPLSAVRPTTDDLASCCNEGAHLPIRSLRHMDGRGLHLDQLAQSRIY